MTDFRALCVELTDCLEKADWPHQYKVVFQQWIDIARAALAESDGPAVSDDREPASVTDTITHQLHRRALEQLDDSYESDLTEEESTQLLMLCGHAIGPPLSLIDECLVAYWNNERFGNSLIDAPERMQAVFDVLAEWCDQLCYSDTAERLREASGKVDG